MNFIQRIIIGSSIAEVKDLIMATQAEFDAKVAEFNTKIAGLVAAETKLKADNEILAKAIKDFIAANVSTLDISGLQAALDGIDNASVDINAIDAAVVAETASITPTP
jgi:hypothetical protein